MGWLVCGSISQCIPNVKNLCTFWSSQNVQNVRGSRIGGVVIGILTIFVAVKINVGSSWSVGNGDHYRL